MELNKVYCENCLDTMYKMPDGFIDLTVTSPPYDDLRNYNGYVFDFESVARELYRITKQGGVVVWVVGDATKYGSESGTSFRQALFFMNCGFNLHDTMIYHSEKPPLTHNRYEQKFEYMFVFSKGKLSTFNGLREPSIFANQDKGASTRRQDSDALTRRRGTKAVKETKLRGNIWKYATGAGCSTLDSEAFQHPAIFPEQLANDHIVSWSNEGDLVYDPFSGSGTTWKMSLLNNRQFIGSEISDEYVKLSENRVKDLLPTYPELD